MMQRESWVPALSDGAHHDRLMPKKLLNPSQGVKVKPQSGGDESSKQVEAIHLFRVCYA